MENKKILVTGATGFIASHTCVELIEAGYKVVGIDNFANSKPEVLNKIINTNYLVASFDKFHASVGSDKAGSAGYENFFVFHYNHLLL